MRTFRSRRGSSVRAIAGRSWRSTISSAPPTTSPITRRLPPTEKLALLDRLEATLLGRNDDEPAGVALRTQLAERRLAPRHAQDLLTAFRMDVTKLRYRDWDDLIGYCTYSAMPVGRFVLDVHGESRALWPANDALCAALQIINHLQDCGKDYRDLDRVYIPLDAFAEAGATVDALGAERATPALLRLHPQARAPHRRDAPAREPAVLRRDRRYAARPGGRRHPGLCGAPRRHAAPARSAERARASRQGRDGAASASSA